MRATIVSLLFAASTFVIGCGGSSSPTVDFATGKQPDLTTTSTDSGGGTPSLTVNNTFLWCSVTVTVGTAAPVTFTGATMSFPAAAGTVIDLSATPQPTFEPVKWTGVTTMSGTTATYTMTGDAAQSVTACCAESNGTGC